MHALIESHRDRIAEVCRRHGVARLEVFGSAARGVDFDPAASDADFLVSFKVPDGGPTFQTQLDLADALEEVLGRRVDLMTRSAVEASPNYIRRRRILTEAQTIYG